MIKNTTEDEKDEEDEGEHVDEKGEGWGVGCLQPNYFYSLDAICMKNEVRQWWFQSSLISLIGAEVVFSSFKRAHQIRAPDDRCFEITNTSA